MWAGKGKPRPGEPWGTSGCSLGNGSSVLGNRGQAQLCLLGLNTPALQSWELLWPLLAPSHWPRDHLLWGGNISAPLGLSGRCGFGGSKGLNKEMLFLVLRKFIKSIYGAVSCGWEISCGRRGWILWGCFGAPVCLGGVLG